MFLKKLSLVILIIVTLFILAVFKLPTLSNTIEWWVWLDGISDTIRWVKTTVDQVSTDIPTKDELKDTYYRAYSWAIDAKDNVEEGITDTKNLIDSFRKTLSWAEAMYNDAKWVYEDTKEVIDDVQDKIETAKDILEDGQELQDTLSDNLNKEILE